MCKIWGNGSGDKKEETNTNKETNKKQETTPKKGATDQADKKKPPELQYGKSKHQERKEQWTENLEASAQKPLDFLTGLNEVGAVLATVSKTALTVVSNPYVIVAYAAVVVCCLVTTTFAEEIVDFVVDGSVSALLDPCECFQEHYTRCYEDEEYRKAYGECCFECTGDQRMDPDKLEPKIPDSYEECKSGCTRFTDKYCKTINPDTKRPIVEDYRRCCDYCFNGRYDAEFRMREMDKWINIDDLKPPPELACFENCFKGFTVYLMGYLYCKYRCYTGYDARKEAKVNEERSAATIRDFCLLTTLSTIQSIATLSLCVFLLVTGCVYRKRPKPSWFIIALVAWIYYVSFSVFLTCIFWPIVSPNKQKKLGGATFQIMTVMVPVYMMITQEIRAQKQSPQSLKPP